VASLSRIAYNDEFRELLQALARIHGDDVEGAGEVAGVGRIKQGGFMMKADGY